MNRIKKSKEETMIGAKRREILAFVVLLLMPKSYFSLFVENERAAKRKSRARHRHHQI